MRMKKIVKITFFSIGALSTLLAIWSISIKIKPNEKQKKQKIGANWMEFQQFVLQFVKLFTVYYTKCVFPRIWVSKVYV
jgi:hypothetical protein